MSRTSRLVAVLATGALALGLAAAPTGAASAARVNRADRAGDWLQGQLTRGLIHNPSYGGFDDYGLSADTGTALIAVGGHGKAVRQVRHALAKHVNSWTTGVDFGSSDVYAGSVAKAAVFAQASGANPRSFGGVNLISRLNKRVSSQPGIVGRLQDKTSSTDYANVLGQAYAVGALNRAHSGKAAAATRFLLKQQCGAGYFRLYFSAPTAKDQTCDGAPRAQRPADPDATAIALINLQSIKHPSTKVRTSIERGLRWLHRKQRANGSFGGGVTTKAPNANSTGLAGWALAVGGRCADAKQAARWVVGLQKHNGAIAYDKATLKKGIHNATDRDQWRRSTSQAAPVLRYLNGCRGA